MLTRAVPDMSLTRPTTSHSTRPRRVFKDSFHTHPSYVPDMPTRAPVPVDGVGMPPVLLSSLPPSPLHAQLGSPASKATLAGAPASVATDDTPHRSPASAQPGPQASITARP
jgi:hypothetical protein